MTDLPYINKKSVTELLPMKECIPLMEQMFRSLGSGQCLQPLRSLMWLPDKTGILGMMPGYAEELGVMGIKVISVFHHNLAMGIPSHQGVVMLFDAKQGQPLISIDASEITAIRTAAASAVATKYLARENAESLAMIGSGEQARRHIEAMLLVRKIKTLYIWSRNPDHANALGREVAEKYKVNVMISPTVKEAVSAADIICTVTSSPEPLVLGDWLSRGAHINAVGSSIARTRELDSNAVLKSSLYTDCYDSLFHEAGDFLIPLQEGFITNEHVQGEIGEVILQKKKGRKDDKEITLYKSLGIAAEDIFSAWHIYKKFVEGNPK
ncbi:MAG TPA: ornithine cyclodeaminase family protein [Chitinophagaceae bacterium]|nr:ornithine cyclodeaminase family protein [Chitinophagaceae bacterium]